MTRFATLFASRQASPVRRSRTRLGLECFEDRAVPASLVVASLSGGALTLTAQDLASSEDLVLTNAAIPGSITVTGTGATTIQFAPGMTAASHDFAGVKSVSVFLKGGADSLNAQGIFLNGNLTINGGDGGNTITLSNGTFVGGTVTVTNGGGGLDTVTVNNAHIGKNLVVNQGIGNDQSLLDIFGNTFIGGSLQATGGAGMDTVQLDTVYVGSKIADSGGLGADTFSLLNTHVGSSVTASLGDGGNTASLTSSTVAGAVAVNSGAGVDSLTLLGLDTGGNVTAALGDGADIAECSDLNIAGNVSFSLGNGDNMLHFDSNNSGSVGSFLFGNLTITGGTGSDSVATGLFHPVFVGGRTSMTLGRETINGDTVVIEDTTFLGAVNIDFGGGVITDRLFVDTDVTQAGIPTRFAGKLTVTLGAGSDQVQLGVGAAPDRRVLFGVLPSFDGGTSPADNDLLTKTNGFINGADITGLTNFYKNFETVGV